MVVVSHRWVGVHRLAYNRPSPAQAVLCGCLQLFFDLLSKVLDNLFGAIRSLHMPPAGCLECLKLFASSDVMNQVTHQCT